MATRRPVSAAGLDGMRRKPLQQRALQTIEALFRATVQIVEKDGPAAATTNRIAAQAGYSIGTLYQYFPSREALLLAMVHRERDRFEHQLQALLETAVAERRPVRGVLQEMVAQLVLAFGTGDGRRSSRAMVRLAWQVDHQESLSAALRAGSERHVFAFARLVAGGDGSLRTPTPAMTFVAVRALIGTIRSASLEDSPLLGTPEFEDELVRMLWGHLQKDAAI